jgi:hypothetical protein
MKIETSGSPGLNIAMSENAELIWVGAKKYKVPLQAFSKFFDEMTKGKKEKSSKKRAQYWLKLLSFDEAQANSTADVLTFFAGTVVAGGYRIYKQFCSGDANGEGRSQMKICNSKDEDAVKSLFNSGALNSFKCDDDRLTELKSGIAFGEHRFVFQYDGEDRLERVKDFVRGSECEYFIEKGRVVKTHGNGCRSVAKGQGPQAITEVALARINSCCRNPECVSAVSGKESPAPAIAPIVPGPITPAVR